MVRKQKKYKRIIRNTKNDTEFYVSIDRILKDLHNGHVNILSGRGFRYLYTNYYLAFLRYDDLKDLAWYDVFSNPFVMNRYQFDGNLDDIELYNEPVLETKILIENDLAYMRIKQMAGLDVGKEDYYKIKDFLKDVENYGKLIIDIRVMMG